MASVTSTTRTPHSTISLGQPSRGFWNALAFAAPVVLILALIGVYLVSPSFYLAHVLEPHAREMQAVEILTEAAALSAAILLGWSGFKLWRQARAVPGASRLPGGPLLILVAGLAAFFFAGEEINWGQTYLGWEVSEEYFEKTGSNATNLHNLDHFPISIQGLGSLYVAICFIGLPLLWTRRHKLALPRDWAAGVAEWPVAWCMVVAMIWKWHKNYFQLTHSDEELAASLYYMRFVEQINEQREMLIAVGLLMYGLYKWRQSRQGLPMSPVGRTNGPGDGHQ